MQANLFKILAIAAAFSAVHSAPVETAEGQVAQGQVNGTQVDGTQVNGTQANKAHTNETQVSDKPIQILQTCYKKRDAPISIKEREGNIFARACRDYDCWLDTQCISWGCSQCVLYFDMCGNSWNACH
ncbi:hypothetical protein GGS24DRAFT_461897 [Hypoxylon argillaceum]|nr:hypothetical protein GGS24DRAFT_461897 [Hypoxylon argillaceum]